MSPWYPLQDGFSDGVGSEGGQVRLDEEHPLGARITLEEGGTVAPWAITCGIYGWMVHTVFCESEEEGRAKVEQMKADIDAIIEIIPKANAPDADERSADVVQAIEKLVDRY